MKLFQYRQDLVDHAALSVALFWLNSGEKILARAEMPAPLSPQAYDLARMELSREIYAEANGKNYSLTVAVKAVALARERLFWQAERWPRMARAFPINSLLVYQDEMDRIQKSASRQTLS